MRQSSSGSVPIKAPGPSTGQAILLSLLGPAVLGGACRRAPAPLPRVEAPARSVPPGWCAVGCTGEVAYELDLDQAFGTTTPGSLLAPYLGTRKGIWIHPELDPESRRFQLVPDHKRRPGSFTVSFEGTKAQHMRAKLEYAPNLRDPFGCPLIGHVCRDYLAYKVSLQIKSKDQTLDEQYSATLEIHPRTYDKGFGHIRERARIAVVQSPVSWSGTQSHRRVNETGNPVIRDYLQIFFSKKYWGHPELEVSGYIEETQSGEFGSYVDRDGDELFYFKPRWQFWPRRREK